MNYLEWLSKLIAIDTTSRNSNLHLIDLVRDWFARHHIPVRLTHDPKEKKANLFATIEASDNRQDGGLILSGHTDVVSVDGQKWKTNPFEAVKIDDKIYGRGTCDMKGFLAVALALVPEFQKLKLQKPLHFAFSYDEEPGATGAPHLIEDLQKAGFKPAGCIVGEPTAMSPIVGHKGLERFRCRFHGHAVHSSLTSEGCNALEHAAKLICILREYADDFRKIGPFDEYFDVPYTSLTVTLIQGGNVINTIPAYCEFSFEFRYLPQVDPRGIVDKIESAIQRELLPQMRKEKSTASIDLELLVAVPSFAASEEADVTRLVRALTGDPVKRKAAYGTEAGLFEKAHIPTVICGPGHIDQAHRADEFIALDQLERCHTFLRRAVQQFCCK